MGAEHRCVGLGVAEIIMASATFQKREKETKRKDKAREKEAKREARAINKVPRGIGPDGVDADIAGIIPGPQPMPIDD